uniref:Beta-galactoside alpha--sialyltransferase 1 n=1 Tax=Tetraselmis sp. GSL018 TaxID=582737 RepID=A0A061SDR3_9CHLO
MGGLQAPGVPGSAADVPWRPSAVGPPHEDPRGPPCGFGRIVICAVSSVRVVAPPELPAASDPSWKRREAARTKSRSYSGCGKKGGVGVAVPKPPQSTVRSSRPVVPAVSRRRLSEVLHSVKGPSRRLTYAHATSSLSEVCKRHRRAVLSRAANRAPLSEGRQALADCLRGDPGCHSADPDTLRSEAESLPGIKAIRRAATPCFLTTRSGECSRLGANPETGNPRDHLHEGEFWPFRMRPSNDLRGGQFQTCALVSNGPLVKIARNRQAIDSHESVWRFNLMSAGPKQGAFAGTKTTMRMFNRLRGIQAMETRAGRGLATKEHGAEQWLFWNSASAAYITDLKRRYPNVPMSLLHSNLLTWIVNVYFKLRSDIAGLGLHNFSCPDNISSGIHSLLMSLQVCKSVNLFGFSYSQEVLRTRPGHMDETHSMYAGHSWALDATMIRLLHLSGLVNVCTADDPSIDLKDLRSGRIGATHL